jgi:signal-transduction protein with cAMP-binding, CBS, and nucleotidyltransferase domain
MTTTIWMGPNSHVGRLIRGGPVVVQAGWSVGMAAQAMRDGNVSSALVGDGKSIVTERDLTRALAAGIGPEAEVSVAAVDHPVTVDATTSVVDAASEMLHQEIRHLVVADAQGILGVVSLRDVMVVLLQAMDPEVWVSTLRAAVTGHSELWLG